MCPFWLLQSCFLLSCSKSFRNYLKNFIHGISLNVSFWYFRSHASSFLFSFWYKLMLPGNNIFGISIVDKKKQGLGNIHEETSFLIFAVVMHALSHYCSYIGEISMLEGGVIFKPCFCRMKTLCPCLNFISSHPKVAFNFFCHFTAILRLLLPQQWDYLWRCWWCSSFMLPVMSLYITVFISSKWILLNQRLHS